MNQRKSLSRGASAVLILLILVGAGCATRPAPGIGGRWKPVNRFQEQTQALPLRPAYVFQATPMDRTLKSMLERWSRDQRMVLAYEHDADFTLHAPVAQLRSDDLPSAIAQLNAVYAPQQVNVSAEGSRIVVRRGAPAGAASTQP